MTRFLSVAVLCLMCASMSRASTDLESAVGTLFKYLDHGFHELLIGEAPGLLERVKSERGGNDPLAGRVHMGWGLALVALNRGKEGNRHLREARSIFKRTGHYAEVLEAQVGIAEGRARQGRSQDAINAYEGAVSDAKRYFGYESAQHANMLLSHAGFLARFEYGSLNVERRAYRKARSYILRALKIRETVFGEDAAAVADVHRYLTENYYALNDWGKGLKHAETAAHIYENADPPRYADAATMRQFLAWGLEEEGDMAGAAKATDVRYAQFDALPEPVNIEFARCAARSTRDAFARLRFNVNKSGKVANAVVLDALPSEFGRNAAEAAETSWRYRPRFINGIPVASSGIEYELACIADRDNLKARQREIGRAPTGAR